MQHVAGSVYVAGLWPRKYLSRYVESKRQRCAAGTTDYYLDVYIDGGQNLSRRQGTISGSAKWRMGIDWMII